jgi:hypothetical protein
MSELFTFKGMGLIYLFDEEGRLIREEQVRSNFIADIADAHVAKLLVVTSPPATPMGWMAIGTGTGQERSDTALSSEVARVALDSKDLGSPASEDNDAIYVATFGSGVPAGGGIITEYGVFNNAGSSPPGDMLFYTDAFTAVTKGATQTLVITHTVTVGQS